MTETGWAVGVVSNVDSHVHIMLTEAVFRM
jgi:hypothetical protein